LAHPFCPQRRIFFLSREFQMFFQQKQEKRKKDKKEKRKETKQKNMPPPPPPSEKDGPEEGFFFLMIIRTHKRNRSFSIYCDVRQLFYLFFLLLLFDP
jgi:hypothetical protein